MALHTGSWLGMPDFGITEWTSNLLSGGQTPDLSKAITGNYQSQTQRSDQDLDSIRDLDSTRDLNSTPPIYGPFPVTTRAVPQLNMGRTPPVPTRPSQEDIARQQAEAELRSLNTAYDQNAANAQNQLSSLSTQRESSLANLQNSLSQVQASVGQSKTSAQTETQNQINKALTTAKDVQKQNRNVLRALGILSSTAAGEALNKPMSQFDQQRAELGQSLLTRIQQLDDFYNQKVTENQSVVKQINDNYNNLVNQIQSDLRFNDRQRADAIRQANSALTQRISEIASQQQQYQQAVKAQQNTYTQQLTELANYVNPQANLSNISQMTINPTQATNPLTTGLLGTIRKDIYGQTIY